MAIFDSHFHLLSMKKKGIDTALLDPDITGIEVGTDLHDILSRIDLLQPYRNLQFSQGIGPWALDRSGFSDSESESLLLEKDLLGYGGAFIGECGLDYHWMYGTKKDQMGLFRNQIYLSNNLGLPIIIHSRDADDDMVDMLLHNDFRYGGVMHCFSSGWEVAKKALDKGLMISFSGNVTYKSNTFIREAATKVPEDMILYETDSPYLAPVPFRGRPSDPSMTGYTAAFIAQLRSAGEDDFRNKVLENFSRLLGRSKCVRK